MFLIYLDDKRFAGLTESQPLGFGNSMLDYDEELKRSGHYVLSEPLKAVSDAVTAR